MYASGLFTLAVYINIIETDVFITDPKTVSCLDMCVGIQNNSIFYNQQEVTLVKGVEQSSSNQIGLIVTSSGIQQSSTDTNKGDILGNVLEHSEDVFISGVQPESIAYRDGRLRQGDQILRINGLDVKNQEELETQIARSSTSVTLLVSRILYPVSRNF